MGVQESKTFMSGNSVALRLPKALGIGPNENVTIEQVGDVLTIRRLKDPAVEKARLNAMLDDLLAMGSPADGIQERDVFEFPDRPDL